MRRSFTTKHIPILMLTACAGHRQQVHGLEGRRERLRHEAVVEGRAAPARAQRRSSWRAATAASPLTGLPGNHSINDEIKRRLANGNPFALLARRGSGNVQRLLRLRARRRGDPDARAHPDLRPCSVAAAEGFVGHIGGDDFDSADVPENAEDWARHPRMVQHFARGNWYDPEDRERGSWKCSTAVT